VTPPPPAFAGAGERGSVSGAWSSSGGYRSSCAGGTWSDLWRWAAARLGDELAAGRLLEALSGLDRARLLVAAGGLAPAGAADRLASLVERVEAGEPLQYVVGRWGFRTLDLVVEPGVLIPRPETEVVAGVAIAALRSSGGRVGLDLGTGSGAIALSLAVEVAGTDVFAVDRSPAALRVAAANVARLPAGTRRRVRLLAGDWYSALRVGAVFDVIVANPPYVSAAEFVGLDAVVRLHEPYGALVSGPAGTEALAAVVAGAPGRLAPAGTLVVELAPAQAPAALGLALAAGFAGAEIRQDLAGRDRILVARR
jgi:release factor glutamine methyltransferase